MALYLHIRVFVSPTSAFLPERFKSKQNKQLDSVCFTSITSNVVDGLRNGHVHVFTRSLQSKATNVSLGLVMYPKKQTFFFFQEIITL